MSRCSAIGKVTPAALAALAWMFALDCLATTTTVSGRLPRNLASGQFTIMIVVDGILPSDAVGGTNEDATFWMKNRLKIRLLDDDQAALPYIQDSTPARNYWAEVTNQDVTDGTSGNKKVTVSVNVIQLTSEKPLTTIAASGSVRLTIEYEVGVSDKNSKAENQSIQRFVEVPRESPTDVAVTSMHRGLKVSFQTAAQVLYTNSDSKLDAPGNVGIVVIDTQAESLTLNGYRFDKTQTADPETTCHFNPNASEGEQCITCGDNAADDATSYLNFVSIGNSLAKSVLTTEKFTLINGLDETKTYAVVVSYLEGVTRSACYFGKPVLDYTLSELNGDKDATPARVQCFIATAAYGSALDRHVDSLRWLRDNVLERSALGSAFVRAYYRLSPPIAEIVAKNPRLAALTRAMLWVPVKIAEGLRFVMGSGE